MSELANFQFPFTLVKALRVPVLVSKLGITTCQTGSYQVVKWSNEFVQTFHSYQWEDEKSLILDT